MQIIAEDDTTIAKKFGLEMSTQDVIKSECRVAVLAASLVLGV